MGLTVNETAAIEAARAAPMLAQVERWVAVNTGTRNLPGLAVMAGLLADAFSALPGTLALIEPAAVEQVDISGTVQPIAHGHHLHLRVRPHAPVQMLFTGHMDTVFPADHPFQTATYLPDGRLNAPGAADMKGGIAVMLAALLAVERGPLAAQFGYEVVLNSDEETGSFASAALIAQAARGKHAALTYEPALPDGTLAGARGGTGNFSIVVRGRSAHAGRNPRDGRNALVAAADLAVRLSALMTQDLSVNPARIDGGGPNNVVPDLAILRVNFRPVSHDVIARAGEAVRRIAAEVATEHDVDIHVHGSFNRPPKPLDPGAERLFALVKAAGADLSIPIAWKATGGVCDGNNIAACGVPVVDTMGARGGAIHSEEEFLIPDSLPGRAALSALTILRIIQRGGRMTFIIRPARPDDLQHLYEMAKLTGGGFTNLPPERPALRTKLERSAAAFSRTDDSLADELFVLVLENTATGDVRGTCQIFTQVGQRWPFYSYRLGTVTKHSEALDRTFRAEILNLVNDLEGASEVGGLFLHPGERAGGLGMLLARSRYLFIAMHRARFADRILAELRGVIDEAAGSPFWDGVAGRFFGMSFQQADEFNAIHGNQFIADLMPKHPVYTAMLTEHTRSVIGVPHPSGRAAMRMLENEGFAFESYIDIFDGGPTMTARTDQVVTIRSAKSAPLTAVAPGGDAGIIARGKLADFRACHGTYTHVDDRLTIDTRTAGLLGVSAGDEVCHVPR